MYTTLGYTSWRLVVMAVCALCIIVVQCRIDGNVDDSIACNSSTFHVEEFDVDIDTKTD